MIDKLIKEITTDFNITTVINTHDMNSVIEIGQNILFIYQGKKWWSGNKDSIITTDNPEILNFVYASEFMKEIRSAMQEKRT